MKLKLLLQGVLWAATGSLLSACSTTNNTANTATNSVNSPVVSAMSDSGLKVATWNVEHLAVPITNGCRPRTAEELEGLKQYASSLDADIVALQEVESIAAISQLFPSESWQLFISERPDSESYDCRKTGNKSTQQKVGYAVRKGIEVEKVNSLAEFSLDSRGLRHGLELIFDSEFGEVTMLNVHMKSGCFVDNYTRKDSKSCNKLAKQVKVLDSWIEEKEAEKSPYIILGDFNHRLSARYNHLRREMSTNSNGSESSLVNATEEILGCHQYYPAPIDHIFLGNMQALNLDTKPQMHNFANMDPKAMLSDHCALSLELKSKSLPLTNSVKWLRTSKEYQYFTTKAYEKAAADLAAMKPEGNDWVVVMDIDETVLDNSPYQVGIDTKGLKYSSKTWAQWIKAEKAGLVPGAKAFIDTVLAQGGKLALITNRVRSLDNHTWSNLQAMGIPVSTQNTCLMGRVEEDKTAIDHDKIQNDKDLRRQQIETGKASCFNPEGKRKAHFPAQHIQMQVGDNIEDFAGVTQEDANVPVLIKDKSLVLLPNPMYGSW